jgi:hypothetical protein
VYSRPVLSEYTTKDKEMKYRVQKSIGAIDWQNWYVVSDCSFIGWFDSEAEAKAIADKLNQSLS